LDRKLSLENGSSIALVATLMAVGALGWWLRLGPKVYADVSPLESVPLRIGQWGSSDIPLPPAVEDGLRADLNLNRAYQNGTGDVVWLYVGYYGTERGGRPEHTPRGCYTGAGWGIESSQIVDVTPTGTLRANEYVVTNSGERRLVHFWYRSHRRTGILGGFDQNVDRLVGRLFDNRADGALVRVSTPVLEGDLVAARGRVLSFSSLLDPILGEHWPTEIPCSEAGPDRCNPEPTKLPQDRRLSGRGQNARSRVE
jgi:EpsI family protein